MPFWSRWGGGSLDSGSSEASNENNDAAAKPHAAGVFDKLPPNHLAALLELEAKFPNAGRGVLLGYLKHQDWNGKRAAAQYEGTIKWRKAGEQYTINLFAPHMLTPPGCEGPDGCVVCLEDMKGDCARDNLGRPIIVNFGIPWGSDVFMQRQGDYALNRAMQYVDKDVTPCVCNIFDFTSRQGCRTTMRFPDRDLRSVMDMQRLHYPHLLGSPSHICGIPRAIQWAFSLVKPFMPTETYESLILRPDFTHLPAYIPRESILRQWGGSLDFDIAAYIKWRAQEEAVLERVTPETRRYEATSAAAEDMAKQMKTLSAKEVADSLDPQPSCIGQVEKQGSGKGMFGSTRWKTKLLVARGGMAMYFDSTDISVSNTCSQVIPLASSSVKVDEAMWQQGAYVFDLEVSTRSFHFRTKSLEDAQRWKNALEAEIQVADKSIVPGITSADQHDALLSQ